MKRGKFFFIMILCGVLGVASASWAQTGPRREADYPVVRVYGPDVLTDLAGEAIMEVRPDVVIVKDYKPLKNKVCLSKERPGPTTCRFRPKEWN